jgi:type I restriction enzyme S subunit
VRDRFGTIYDTPENVEQLRQTILQLAVMGRLVPQDPNDEPASVLLERIRAEKARLIKEKKIKPSKPLPPISPDEMPFDLPDGWEWVRLGEVGLFQGGGTPNKSRTEFWDGDIPWVRPKDMKIDFIYDSSKHITQLALENSTARFIPKNSLLMVIRGMILAKNFPVAINMRPVTINQDMKAIVFYLDDLTDYFLKACLGMRDRIMSNVSRSSHGTCKLDSDLIANFLFPLPPIAEQKRIVATVDRLMTHCDQLQTQLQTRSDRAHTLLHSAIHQLSQTP